MKHQKLRIADYNHSPTTPYVIEGYRENGKRKRMFFRTRAEAELALARLRIVQRKEGDAGAELGAEGRIEAVRCRQQLARFGKTITDATNFLIQHLEREEKAKLTLTVDKLAALRLTELKRIGRSARPFAGYSGAIYQESERILHNNLGQLYDQLRIRRLPNAGRHSFASYWLAEHHDSAALASRLGHPNSSLVYSVYRELVTPELAEAYWNIRPSNTPSNVVAIA